MSSALLLGVVFAQAVAPPAQGTADLERIRKAVEEQPAIVVAGNFDKPVFRVTIQGWKFDHAMWEEPPAPRPSTSIYHYEFLEMVTPEAFRASTLYPGSIGVPIGAIIDALGKKIRAARHRRAEEQARTEVAAALQELFACRADPARAGCDSTR